MRETVLLINFQDAKQLREIKMILLSMKIKMKTVEKKDYLQKIGYLAGLKDMEAVQEVYDGEELEKEVMIFANLREARFETDFISYTQKRSKESRLQSDTYRYE